ncbi:hypothetical protein GWI33_020149 [Rhynchophorus ferrugineus]|uniref:Uncharacterized protein n=1 Tax=Rhynchophorus ferrugineus TaxID=354439 RepID=A0A834HSY2_RHYFE|nr:hypothetical protein GWI33_020149 [Rhynchophorus ferrugineus]
MDDFTVDWIENRNFFHVNMSIYDVDLLERTDEVGHPPKTTNLHWVRGKLINVLGFLPRLLHANLRSKTANTSSLDVQLIADRHFPPRSTAGDLTVSSAN